MLSEREAKVLSSLSYAGKTIFTTQDLKEFTNNPKKPPRLASTQKMDPKNKKRHLPNSTPKRRHKRHRQLSCTALF